MNGGRLAKRISIGVLIWQSSAALIWLGLVYPSVTTWRESVPWLVFMSVWANFGSHAAGAVAALVGYLAEKRADPDDESLEEP